MEAGRTRINMEQRTKRKRKRRKNWKRIIIAYTLRTLVAVVLLGMVFLMICGCIFLYQLGHKEKDDVSSVNAHVKSQLRGAGTQPDSPLPLTDCKIVLDAGHGGLDGGCSFGDTVEKDASLAVTLALGEYLEAKGIQVVYTRREDDSLGLSERADLVNGEEPDFLFSIHCNSYEEDASIRGLEIHYQKGRKEGKAMAEQIGGWLEENTSIEVRDAKENNLQILRETSVKAVLIELGFLTNAADRQILSSQEQRDELAKALADGIWEYTQAVGR